MDEKQTYAIPANYTDSGKLFGGMLAPRNAIETLILLVVFGYIELFLIPIPTTPKVIVAVITLIPLGMISLMGIDGDSLFQYVGHIFKHISRKRKLHFRRPDDEQAKK
ncbi:MAG: hypothetical protein IJV87_07630 [Clostridia bacterium]|nr:hypothetical protein [Clostridia bacterium]